MARWLNAVMASIISQVAAIAVPPAPTSTNATFSIVPAPTSAVDASNQPVAAASSANMRIPDEMHSFNLIAYQHHGFQGAQLGFFFAVRGTSWDLNFGDCATLWKWSFHNKISSYKVNRICCNFFSDDYCDESKSLFKATDRTDAGLRGAHNDAIGSIKCVEWC